jgi:hypothetical protein
MSHETKNQFPSVTPGRKPLINFIHPTESQVKDALFSEIPPDYLFEKLRFSGWQRNVPF